MKTGLFLTAAILVLLVAGSIWSARLAQNDPTIVSRAGLHWHPAIEIFVRGERVSIPANIGIGARYAGMPTFDTSMRMTAIHTHDDVPVIHLEFPSIVREDDIALGTFFRVWGKELRSFGSNMRMTVNGVENTEYESYIMRDGDKIELHYD
jgi:hypothetical protein